MRLVLMLGRLCVSGGQLLCLLTKENRKKQKRFEINSEFKLYFECAVALKSQ